MLPIDPAELSAFLDGELPAERAEEVRIALALRPGAAAVLRAAGRARRRLEGPGPRPRCSGRGCASTPGSAPAAYGWPPAVIGLLLIRLALKVTPPLLGVGVEVLLLVLFIGWGLRRIVQPPTPTANAPCWGRFLTVVFTHVPPRQESDP